MNSAPGHRGVPAPGLPPSELSDTLSAMPVSEPKQDLHGYLKDARKPLTWKLEGLSEYEARRPLVPTGTNLLGLVKHLAIMEAAYFGLTFGRPFPEPLPWLEEDAEPNSDMWATPEESREDIVGLYRRACAHADATIDALGLDAVGDVPWWPPGERRATLSRILVHMVAETNRHAGHADIVRELIDGSAGWQPGDESLPEMDGGSWKAYRERLEGAARRSSGG